MTIANSYTDLRVKELNFDVRRSRREARAGTAAALAAAGLPQAYEAGNHMIAVAGGTYRGRIALAVGGSAALDDGQTVTNVALTYDSSEHLGANVGIGWQF